jgi:hypothetical protein
MASSAKHRGRGANHASFYDIHFNSRMPMSRPSRIGAFRLTEFLAGIAVIAIIAILAAFLLPTLSKAKERAVTAKWLNQVKQLGVAMTITKCCRWRTAAWRGTASIRSRG